MTRPAMTGEVASPVLPGDWVADPAACTLAFAVRNFGLRTVTGQIPLTSADVSVGPSGQPDSIRAELDARGIRTGNPRRDNDLRGRRFLATDRWPVITFEASYIKPLQTGWTVSGRKVLVVAGGSCGPVSVPTAASARCRAAGSCKAARNRTSCRAAWSGLIESATSKRDVPGRRLVIISSGSALLATTSGRNGTFGSRASAASTPISRVSRSAARRDQANFTKNRSPTGTQPECHSGSSLSASPGTVTGYPLSSRATAPSASRSAAAEHSASHFTSGTLSMRPRLPPSHSAGSGRHHYRDVRASRWPRS
jgi:YceI-like domain